MQYRHIPQANTELSAVGIGAMSFADFYDPVAEEQSPRNLGQSTPIGYQSHDTANIMTQEFKTCYQELPEGACWPRDQFFIATKAGIGSRPETETFSVTSRAICGELENLGRLGVDTLISSTSTDAIVTFH